MNILLDDEATWPADLRTSLQDAVPLLQRYIEFEGTRYVGARGTAEERQRQAIENPHRMERDKVLAQLERSLEPHRVMGCHCTRLTSDEVEDVLLNGLQPLSLNHCRKRLDRRTAAGDLTVEQAATMFRCAERKFARPNLDEAKIWGTLGRNALTDEDGLGNSLSYWGGEVMLEGMPSPPAYYRIGAGCIVEFHIPAQVATLTPIQEAFANRFLFVRGLATDDGTYDICSRQPIRSTEILRVIRCGDPDFETLTRASEWTNANPFPNTSSAAS